MNFIFFLNILRQFLGSIKNVCFPMTCHNCREHVDSPGLCSKCWKNIKWISEPKCRICGMPFEIDAVSVCPTCLKKKPFFDAAISVFDYNDCSKNMILRFKHADSTYLGEQIASWMYRASESDIKNADLIVPVPMHFWKRLRRKYNQAELLARGLSDLSNIKYEPRVLLKSRKSKSQEGLTKEKRSLNVAGSFSIDEKYRLLLEGKTVVLVDDVFTTGATVNECAKVLKNAGAMSVVVVTIARVETRA